MSFLAIVIPHRQPQVHNTDKKWGVNTESGDSMLWLAEVYHLQICNFYYLEILHGDYMAWYGIFFKVPLTREQLIYYIIL